MFKILCIVQAPVPSTDISIIRPFGFLEQQQAIQWQLTNEADFKLEFLHQVDIVIFHRNCHPNGIPILNAVQDAQIPFIYEIDDNYFELPEDLPIGRYMRNPRIVQMVELYFTSANMIKVGSPELVPLAAKYNKNIICHPYAVDLSILDNISPCKNNPFTIGYAGTIYHHQDFIFVIEPINRIANEFPFIHWDFIGCRPEGLENMPNQSFVPFNHNYPSFLQDLYQRNWQIGFLATWIDTPHNRCKTDNKLREYGACRIAGIYSNIPPYSHNVKHGETGLLVENNDEAWFEAMKNLITHENLRNKITAETRQWVEEQRSIPIVAGYWIELFNRILKSKGEKDG